MDLELCGAFFLALFLTITFLLFFLEILLDFFDSFEDFEISENDLCIFFSLLFFGFLSFAWALMVDFSTADFYLIFFTTFLFDI